MMRVFSFFVILMMVRILDKWWYFITLFDNFRDNPDGLVCGMLDSFSLDIVIWYFWVFFFDFFLCDSYWILPPSMFLVLSSCLLITILFDISDSEYWKVLIVDSGLVMKFWFKFANIEPWVLFFEEQELI
jgi:hypothetical protein